MEHRSNFHPTRSRYSNSKPTTRPPTPDKSDLPTSNSYIGGDPFSLSSSFLPAKQTPNKRHRFEDPASSHQSVTQPPSHHNAAQHTTNPSLPHIRTKNLPFASRPAPRLLSSERCEPPPSLPTSHSSRPSSTVVQADSAPPWPRAPTPTSTPSSRPSPTLIAHPNQHKRPSPPPSSSFEKLPRRALSGASTPNGLPASQPPLVKRPSRVPAVPGKDTMQQWAEEKRTHDARRATVITPSDVVDVDADSSAVTRPPVEKRLRAELDGGATRTARLQRKPLSLRSTPVSLRGGNMGVARPIQVPFLKSTLRERAAVKKEERGSEGKKCEDAVVAEEGKGKGTGRRSVGDGFKQHIEYDEEGAKKTMLACLEEKRSVIRLSFLGMTDIQLDNLLRLYEPLRDNVEINRTLILNNNRLSKFSPFRREKMEHLHVRYLDLSRNQLRIAVELSNHIRVLNLSRNCLRELPPMHGMFKLEALDLSHNELESLPPRLCNLRRLEILDLSSNRLKSLPDDCFGEDSSLKCLLLTNNADLAELPQCAEYLRALEELSVKGTTIHSKLMRSDVRLDALGLISLLAGKKAEALAERKANSTRGRSTRNVENDEVQTVT